MRPTLIIAIAAALAGATHVSAQLPSEGVMPALPRTATWLNSKPITTQRLRGKVVLIDFWTYSCVNCLRSLPYVKAWDAKYRSQGLIVIGVHAPEFDFEHDVANVKRAITKLGITYPVVLDNDMKIWNAFHNEYWPAHYFIDAKGRIRHHHFGEGGYEESERVIRTLLVEANPKTAHLGTDTTARVSGTGMLAAADKKNVKSPETYIGYARNQRLVPTQRIQRDIVATYTAPHTVSLNSWALSGSWRVSREYGATAARGAAITFRFRARDLNLVLGPSVAKAHIKFRVTVDGHPPGADAGMDVDVDGRGVLTEHRLYQLVRQHGPVQDRTFSVTFEGQGAQVYAFTFG